MSQDETTKIAILQRDMQEVTKKVDSIEKKMDEGFLNVTKEIKHLEESMRERYAAKWTEKVLAGGVSLILISFLAAIIGLVVIK